MLPVRHGKAWLATGWALVITAIVVCLLPGQDLPNTHVGDKYEHFICYAVLTSYFAGLYSRSSYWKIAVALLCMGIAIEFAQGAMHLGRNADPLDVVANSIGIVIGLVLSLAGLGRWAQWIDSWTGLREPARSE
ncbi:MAG: VanZ family protein [Povalibacter sp.]